MNEQLLLGIPLDMMTITIAAITIGIAVDNSIHYIYRFKEEFNNSNDYHKTLTLCHSMKSDNTIGSIYVQTHIPNLQSMRLKRLKDISCIFW